MLNIKKRETEAAVRELAIRLGVITGRVEHTVSTSWDTE